ncbi:MAG: hypothetical protein O7H41_02105 [Planctomycetota bacterium]|nr:hypothetical protein [Planctomycetota bacterium]
MDAKQFFLRHGEKVALGTAGLIVVIGIFGLLGGGSGEADEITELAESVAEAMKNEPPPLPILENLESIQQRWESTSSTESFTKWGFHKRYYIRRALQNRPALELGRIPEHRPPELRVKERGTDYVVIEWDSQVEDAEIVRTEIYKTTSRDDQGKPVFSSDPVAVLGPGETTYRDTDGIVPRREVVYQARTFAKEIADSDVEKLPAEEAVKTSSPLLVRVPANVYLLPMDLKRGSSIRGIPDEARTMVYKWDPKATRWRRKLYRVLVGEEIGKVEEVSGTGKVDYASGFRLLLVDIKEETLNAGGVKVPKKTYWIKVEEIADPEAKPIVFENTPELRDMLKKLEKSNQLIPPEEPAAEAGGTEDETGTKKG